MPCFHAAGISARLSVSSLAASTTNEHVNRGGRVAKDKIGAAEWEIEHGLSLKEKDLRCFDEDGRLHFLGDFCDMPFLCVGVDTAQVLAKPGGEGAAGEAQGAVHDDMNPPIESVEKQEIEEDSSLTSLGSTPSHTPDRPTLFTDQTNSSQQTSKIKSNKQHPTSQSTKSFQPNRIILINRKHDRTGANLPKVADNATSSILPTSSKTAKVDAVFAPVPAPVTPEPKALTLVAQLDSSTFCRTKDGSSDDIKLDVYFNGRFENCRYLASRDKRTASECAIRFSGRRTHRVLEKTWTFQPSMPRNNTTLESAVVSGRDQTRWDNICKALRKEADAVGFLSDGARPPTGNMLQSLSQMPVPEQLTALREDLDQSFGVIDLIVSLGEGKKFSVKEGYLHEPERLQDTRLDLLSGVKDILPSPDRAQEASSTPQESVSIQHAEVIPSHSTLRSIPAEDLSSQVAIGLSRKDLVIPDPRQHLRAELGHTPVPSPLIAFKSGMLRQLESTSSISEDMKSAMVAAVSPTQSPTMLRHGFAVVLPPAPPGFGKHGRKLQRRASSIVTPVQDSSLPIARVTKSTDMVNVSSGATTGSPSSRLASDSLTTLKHIARRPCTKRDISSLKHMPSILLTDKFFKSPSSTPVAEAGDFSEKTSKKIGFSLKLRMATPKQRTLGKANVFDRPTSHSRSQTQAPEMPSDSGIVASASSPVPPVFEVGKEKKVDAKIKGQLKRKMSRTDFSEDAAPATPATSAEPESKRRRPSMQSELDANQQAQTADAISPRKLLMPPPSSPVKSSDNFVIPELSRNCVVSYSDQADGAGKAQGFRQIRACRGGNFKEKEILCAIRFVVL